MIGSLIFIEYREAPAEPWHLHSEPSEIAPATDNHCLRTLQTRAGDILIVGRSA